MVCNHGSVDRVVSFSKPFDFPKWIQIFHSCLLADPESKYTIKDDAIWQICLGAPAVCCFMVSSMEHHKQIILCTCQWHNHHPINWKIYTKLLLTSKCHIWTNIHFIPRWQIHEWSVLQDSLIGPGMQLTLPPHQLNCCWKKGGGASHLIRDDRVAVAHPHIQVYMICGSLGLLATKWIFMLNFTFMPLPPATHSAPFGLCALTFEALKFSFGSAGTEGCEMEFTG